MSSVSLMPPGAWEWTVDDLDRIPDDGLQYELLDGLLLVTPAPVPLHQPVAAQLFRTLDAARTDEFLVFFGPLDWRPDRRTSLQPDLLVLRTEHWSPTKLTTDLQLVVEILSPSTRRKDVMLKRSKYQDCGLPHYWIVDPGGSGDREPSVEALALVDGSYLTTGTARGDQRLELAAPFPVTLVPADLAADPRTR